MIWRYGECVSGWRSLYFWISGAALLVVHVVSASEKTVLPPEMPALRAHRCTGDTAISLIACQLASQLPRASRVALSFGDASGTGELNAVSIKLQAALADALRRKAPTKRSVFWPPMGEPLRPQVIESARPAAKRDVAKRGLELSQIYLELRLKLGTLSVEASVFTSEQGGFWDRVRSPIRTSQVFLAQAPGDASVRALLARPASIAPPKLTQPFPFGLEAPLALACEYNEKRDGLRIALVGRGSVWIEELSSGKLEMKQQRPWAKLSEVAPVPLREPLASVAFTPEGAVDAGLSDRRFMLRLFLPHDTVARWEGLFPWPHVGCLERSGLGLEKLAACPPGAAGTLPAFSVSGVVDAVAGLNLATVEGRRRTYGAVRKLGTEEALLFGVQEAPLQVSGVGSSLALGDLDGDGVPEVLNSRPTFSPKDDVLEVRWLDNLAAPRLQVPAPEGIVALAVCPWLGGPWNPVLVASRSNLMVFQ